MIKLLRVVKEIDYEDYFSRSYDFKLIADSDNTMKLKIYSLGDVINNRNKRFLPKVILEHLDFTKDCKGFMVTKFNISCWNDNTIQIDMELKKLFK
jgi:hypothetical protein